MIFPDWGTAPETNESPLPLFREWAVDWESGALALRGGEPYTLEGTEAVKLWVRLGARTQGAARWRYSAHSGDYGNELASLLGRSGDAGIRESLLKRTHHRGRCSSARTSRAWRASRSSTARTARRCALP